VPTLLADENQLRQVDLARGFLERQEWTVVSIDPGPKLVEQARALRPELILLSDLGGNPYPTLEELSNDPSLRGVRIVLVVATAPSPERREALAGARVTVVEGQVTPERLAESMARALNLPTRIAFRTRVVFEVKGQTSAREAFYGKMLDISSGGFLLESEHGFEIGALLYCFFSLTPTDPVTFAGARVVHRRALADGMWENGLEFTEIRLDDRRRIAEFVLRQSALTT
jgi:CheY-like chemotaxis protein